jgi:exopolysaccharide biosynthesis protein
VFVLILTSIIATTAWFHYSANRVAALAGYLESKTGLSVTALTLSDVRLYEIGLFTSGSSLGISLIIMIFLSLKFGTNAKAP